MTRLLGPGGRVGDDSFVAGEDDGGAPVAEEPAGDEIRDGLVVILPGERAELDREEQDDLLGMAGQIVAGARDAGGSGDAAKAEDGGALDVRGERHLVDQAGVDGGGRDAGDRGEEDGGDVGRGEAEGLEGAGDGGLAEFDGGGNPLVVGLLEADEFGVAFERQDGVAGVDAAVGVETGEEPWLG